MPPFDGARSTKDFKVALCEEDTCFQVLETNKMYLLSSCVHFALAPIYYFISVATESFRAKVTKRRGGGGGKQLHLQCSRARCLLCHIVSFSN